MCSRAPKLCGRPVTEFGRPGSFGPLAQFWTPDPPLGRLAPKPSSRAHGHVYLQGHTRLACAELNVCKFCTRSLRIPSLHLHIRLSHLSLASLSQHQYLLPNPDMVHLVASWHGNSHTLCSGTRAPHPPTRTCFTARCQHPTADLATSKLLLVNNAPLTSASLPPLSPQLPPTPLPFETQSPRPRRESTQRMGKFAAPRVEIPLARDLRISILKIPYAPPSDHS